MKKTILFLIASILVLGSLHAQNVLKDIRHTDHGEVVRLVLEFRARPNYAIDELKNQKQILIHVRNCAIGRDVQRSKDYSSKVVERMEVAEAGSDLTVTIRTDEMYYLYSGDSYGVKIVLDVFNSDRARTPEQFYSYGAFYYKMGKTSRAKEKFEQLLTKYPGWTGGHYYLGMMDLKQGRTSSASRHFEQVKPAAAEYRDARAQLLKINPNAPAAEPVVSKPPQQPERETEPAVETSEATQSPESEKPSVESSEPDSMSISAVGMPNEAGMEGVYRELYPSDGSISQKLYMLGYASMGADSLQQAIQFFEILVEDLDDDSPVLKNTAMILAELYRRKGDTGKSGFYHTLAGETPPPAEKMEVETSFLTQPVPLWTAIAAVVVAALIMLFIRRRRSESYSLEEPEFSIQEIEEHENIIRQGYEKRDAGKTEETESRSVPEEPEEKPKPVPEPEVEPKPLPKPDPVFTEPATLRIEEDEDPDDNGVPQPEGDEKKFISDILKEDQDSDVDIYNPPMVSEDLDENEEQELIDDERNRFEATRETLPGDQFAEDPKIDKRTAAKKDLIMQMVRNGWETEVIAKELQISQREVEFVVKTSS